MLNSLDLLIIVFMALAALSLLGLCLMFLVRKPIIKKICFYITVALSIYVCSISIRIFGWFFIGQTIFAIILGILSLGALVLEILSKGDSKKYKIAHIIVAVSLILGIVNAFMI